MKQYGTICMAIIAGIFFSTYVAWETVGRAWTVFYVAIIGLLLNSIRRTMHPSIHGGIMVLTAVGVSLSHAIYYQNHTSFLNILFACIVGIYGIWILVNGDRSIMTTWKPYLRDYKKIFLNQQGIIQELKQISPKRTQAVLSTIPTSTIMGIALWFLALLILIPLLGSVDSVFNSIFTSVYDKAAQWLERIINGLFDKPIVYKTIICIIISALILSLTIYFRHTKEHIYAEHKKSTVNKNTYFIATIFISAIYCLFALIQIKYLFGSASLPGSMTYSEYAVQGFWQLTFISIANIILILLAPRDNHLKTSKKFAINLTIMFVASMVIWASGLYRLGMYINVYGLTYMRLLPFTFIILLGYMLVIAFIGIWRPAMERPNLLAYGIVIRFALFQLMGVDRIIANHNIKRYMTGASNMLDVTYLTSDLSKDQLSAPYNLTRLNDYLAIPGNYRLSGDKNLIHERITNYITHHK